MTKMILLKVYYKVIIADIIKSFKTKENLTIFTSLYDFLLLNIIRTLIQKMFL